MQGQIQKIRRIAHDIENKKASFKDLYAYLDSLQQIGASCSDSSDEDMEMQKYIAPVRNMLGQYKKQIKDIRQTQRMLSRSTDVSQKENICPNDGRDLRKKAINRKQPSMRQLDEEIQQITKKLRLY